MLANTFASKYGLPDLVVNEFSFSRPVIANDIFSPIRVRDTTRELQNLDIDSGTGPDNIAIIVLKQCRHTLSLPLTKLFRAILRQGRWPETWTVHWIMPLYKRKLIFDPNNYRGIYLTSQILKLAERVLR